MVKQVKPENAVKAARKARKEAKLAQKASQKEHRRKQKKLGNHERQFMPAALEILETPPNPLGRTTIWALILMFSSAAIWSYFGKIDVVAVATGRVAPIGGAQVVQAREVSNVVAIHVQEGDYVKAGDILIELDATDSEVDIEQLTHERDEAALNASRITSFIGSINDTPVAFNPTSDASETIIQGHRNRLLSDIAAFEASTRSLEADISRGSAALATIEAELIKLQQTLPLVEKREQDLAELLEQKLTQLSTWQQSKIALIQITNDLDIVQLRRDEAKNSLKAAESRLEGFRAETLRTAYEQLATANERKVRIDLGLRKVTRREDQQKLRAPVTGTVHQLSLHTIGGVVRPVEPIMSIVPENAILEVRANVLNRDKGVIKVGQRAEVKLSAFDFTRYGALDGTVVSVSNDAVSDSQGGLVYPARIKLDATSIRVDNENVVLTPGLVASVEIKTGQRRVIDFLLSPIQRYRSEAMRER